MRNTTEHNDLAITPTLKQEAITNRTTNEIAGRGRAEAYTRVSSSIEEDPSRSF